jgi:hypothetical protein
MTATKIRTRSREKISNDERPITKTIVLPPATPIPKTLTKEQERQNWVNEKMQQLERRYKQQPMRRELLVHLDTEKKQPRFAIYNPNLDIWSITDFNDKRKIETNNLSPAQFVELIKTNQIILPSNKEQNEYWDMQRHNKLMDMVRAMEMPPELRGS